jgi:hypothetical protein
MATIKALMVVFVVVFLAGCANRPGSVHSPYGAEFLADE